MRLLSVALSLVIVGLLAPPALADAQDAPPLRPGARIRVSAPTVGEAHVTTLRGVRGDTLWLVGPDSAAAPVPLAEVTRLEVSRGVHGRALRGLGIGVLAGVVTGAVLGFADGNDPPGWFSYTAGEKAAIGGTLLGVAGAGVGTIVGAFVRSERWTPVQPPPTRAALRLSPRAHGVGLAVAVPF